MKARSLLTATGTLLGAGLGAVSMYVALKPKLRRKLKQSGLSRESLSLIGHDMKKEAGQIAHDVKDMAETESHRLGKARRSLVRGFRFARKSMHKALQDAVRDTELAKTQE